MSSFRSSELRRRTLWMGDICPDWSIECIQSFFYCVDCRTADNGRVPSITVPGVPGLISPPKVTIKLNARSGWTHTTGVRVGFALVEFESEDIAQYVLQHFSGLPIPGVDNALFNLKTNQWKGSVSDITTLDSFAVEEMVNENLLEPPLHAQLEPLTMSQIRDRLRVFKCEFVEAERKAMMAGGRVAKKAELIRLLCKYHCSALGFERSPRQRVFVAGEPVNEDLLKPLLACLQTTQWSPKTRNVTAQEYLVLGVPAANAAPRNTDKYPQLWKLVCHLMQTMVPSFEFSSVAVTRNFTGSPHVDMGDRCWQYAISLGDFHSGGELCVETAPDRVCVIDTHGRLARMDGRYPHWVRSFTGERFSLIFYRITGSSIPPVQAVYTSLTDS